MKHTKILTVLGVLLAIGVTACGGKGGKSSSRKTNTSSSQSGGQTNPLFENVADPEGHHFGEETDVAADAAAGAVAYKKAVCSDAGCNVQKFRINQSSVTFASGSSNKNGTPNGYVKLDGNNQSLSFKFKVEGVYTGKFFLLGRMDGYSTDGNQTVGLYRQGSPNIAVEINGAKADLSSKSDYKYSDTFGTDYVTTDLGSPSNYLSHEGYVEVCSATLTNGVNEFKYTRLASQNMIVRDFVFVVTPQSN